MIDIDNFVGENVKTGQIKIENNRTYQLRPVKLYLKEDGAMGDKPSFAILLVDPYNHAAPVIGQVSLDMWNKAMNEVGYEIVKK
jgi:hypothetical protein